MLPDAKKFAARKLFEADLSAATPLVARIEGLLSNQRICRFCV